MVDAMIIYSPMVKKRGAASCHTLAVTRAVNVTKPIIILAFIEATNLRRQDCH